MLHAAYDAAIKATGKRSPAPVTDLDSRRPVKKQARRAASGAPKATRGKVAAKKSVRRRPRGADPETGDVDSP